MHSSDELWWLIEAKRPPTMYGGLTEHDVADLREDLARREREERMQRRRLKHG